MMFRPLLLLHAVSQRRMLGSQQLHVGQVVHHYVTGSIETRQFVQLSFFSIHQIYAKEITKPPIHHPINKTHPSVIRIISKSTPKPTTRKSTHKQNEVSVYVWISVAMTWCPCQVSRRGADIPPPKRTFFVTSMVDPHGTRRNTAMSRNTNNDSLYICTCPVDANQAFGVSHKAHTYSPGTDGFARQPNSNSNRCKKAFGICYIRIFHRRSYGTAKSTSAL